MLLTALPAGAETIDELRAQLAAQKRINELLKQRIRTLEADPAAHGAPKPPPPVAAQETPQDEEEDRALERALERRGAAVLRPGVVEVTPSFSWTHSGKEANRSSDDIYTAAVDGRVGLPGGWMIGAKAPFLLRSRAGFDDNLGVGDVSAQIWKQIMVQDGTLPSLVGSLRYTAPTGEDFSEASVPLGSGFHRLSSQLSAVKSIAPIAYWGNASYTHNFTRSFDGVEIDRSGTFGFEAGATLAVELARRYRAGETDRAPARAQDGLAAAHGTRHPGRVLIKVSEDRAAGPPGSGYRARNSRAKRRNSSRRSWWTQWLAPSMVTNSALRKWAGMPSSCGSFAQLSAPRISSTGQVMRSHSVRVSASSMPAPLSDMKMISVSS
jgi:hypothetical protein